MVGFLCYNSLERVKSMLFKQLKYFIAIVDYQSFTKASEECYISQSAISQQMKALENELGATLFVRDGRQVKVTQAGQYLYEQGKLLLEDIEHIKQETIRISNQSHLSLTIGYPKNMSSLILNQAISHFTHLYKDVNVSIVSGTHEELFELLINKQIDIKISEQRRAFHQDYHNYELKYCNCYIEIPEDHILASYEQVTVEDLRKLSCILVVSKGKEKSEEDFYENILGLSHRFIHASSLEEARLMVLSHRGYMVIDDIGKLPEPLQGIRRIPLYNKDKPIQRNYFACWSKENKNEYIEEFVEIFKQFMI